MSEEFIQYYFPCNECLVQAACKDRNNITSVKNYIKGINHSLPSLGLPKFEEGKSYHKGLIECWANIGKDMMDRVPRSEDINGAQKDDLPMRYVHIMISMAEVMGYMIHSASWREGKTFDFDRDEIKRKLSHLKGWL
ncbi:hypothetical protein KAR91_42615 [Candidatus Pacearchaeota archaeon]|nr:hypothetical protein [Candidatus Pacearchaeota archaeon]